MGIEIFSYYNDKTPNNKAVSINGYTFFFSYRTCIAVQTPSDLFCSENVWSVTTGKHLNNIQPDKSKRVDYEDFKAILDSINIGINADKLYLGTVSKIF